MEYTSTATPTDGPRMRTVMELEVLEMMEVLALPTRTRSMTPSSPKSGAKPPAMVITEPTYPEVGEIYSI